MSLIKRMGGTPAADQEDPPTKHRTTKACRLASSAIINHVIALREPFYRRAITPR